MNRTTVWLLAALLPAVAAAQVRLYGNIRSGVEVSQTKTGSESRSRASVSDFGSYIGLSGLHPIGGGATNAVWKFEQEAPAGSSGSMRDYFREKKAGGGLNIPN
ncbi:porin [Neisseria musculi]|uniref:Gram-negative porin family protein n=1 Tax=Neisseria musculi TaxID=1815583 RepID=A0A7H1M8K5_9NEIS|nr:porin [Neisseria musculi]QNT57970.1 gram-negative porin family protein [Neisseria musculi]